MKIPHDNSINQASLPAARPSETRPAGRADRYAQNGASGVSLGDDHVELSNFAGQVSASDRADAAARAARVQEIARLYQSGRYSADARQVSAKIVESALNQAPAQGTE